MPLSNYICSCRTPALLLAAAAVALLLRPPTVGALDNGLAQTPPLAFNTWNCYYADIDEWKIRETANLLVSTGLRDLGYRYLVVDDGWSAPNRSAEGRLVGDTRRFPSGIGALADYVHGRGLKFGIYSDSGRFTCQGFPGSRGHEEADAQTWADWGVDYLKYDNCYAEDDILARFGTMRDALNATGRPVLYSLCSWGVGDPWLWGGRVGHTWRTTMDIGPSYTEILHKLDDSIGLARFAGPRLGWNDLDMLEVGNLRSSERYYRNVERAHFALWALLKSPLVVGTNLSTISPASLAILRAREVIAVNQDPLGVAGDLIWKSGPKEIYAAPLSSGRRAVVFFSRHTHKTQASMVRTNITLRWSQVGYANETRLLVRDLFAERDLGIHTASFTASVAIHDVCMVSLAPEHPEPPHSGWRPWHGQPLFEPHEEDSSWIRFDTSQQVMQDGRGEGGSGLTPQMTAAGQAKLQRAALARARDAFA